MGVRKNVRVCECSFKRHVEKMQRDVVRQMRAREQIVLICRSMALLGLFGRVCLIKHRLVRLYDIQYGPWLCVCWQQTLSLSRSQHKAHVRGWKTWAFYVQQIRMHADNVSHNIQPPKLFSVIQENVSQTKESERERQIIALYRESFQLCHTDRPTTTCFDFQSSSLVAVSRGKTHAFYGISSWLRWTRKAISKLLQTGNGTGVAETPHTVQFIVVVARRLPFQCVWNSSTVILIEWARHTQIYLEFRLAQIKQLSFPWWFEVAGTEEKKTL